MKRYRITLSSGSVFFVSASGSWQSGIKAKGLAAKNNSEVSLIKEDIRS